MLAGEADDGTVEGAAEASLGRADHEQVRAILAVAGQQLRRLRAVADAAREVGQHLLHALREGTGGLGGHLGAAQFGGRDQLHAFVIFWVDLTEEDPVPQVLQGRHIEGSCRRRRRPGPGRAGAVGSEDQAKDLV